MADTSDIEASNSVVSVPVSLVAMIPLRYWTLVRARDPEQASRRRLVFSHLLDFWFALAEPFKSPARSRCGRSKLVLLGH